MKPLPRVFFHRPRPGPSASPVFIAFFSLLSLFFFIAWTAFFTRNPLVALFCRSLVSTQVFVTSFLLNTRLFEQFTIDLIVILLLPRAHTANKPRLFFNRVLVSTIWFLVWFWIKPWVKSIVFVWPIWASIVPVVTTSPVVVSVPLWRVSSSIVVLSMSVVVSVGAGSVRTPAALFAAWTRSRPLPSSSTVVVILAVERWWRARAERGVASMSWKALLRRANFWATLFLSLFRFLLIWSLKNFHN